MRIAGSALLFVGLILCASIDWAAVGFVTMGAGLLCFQAAESKREAIVVQGVQSSIGPIARSGGQFADRAHSTNFDRERWRRLVEMDRDIAQAEAILARCGAKYAEQFARAYLIFENKALLSGILSTIVASYRLDSGLDGDVGAKTIANFSVGTPDFHPTSDRPQADLRPAPRPESADPVIEKRPTHATLEQDRTPDAVPIDNDAEELDAASPAENDSTENLKQLLEWLDRPAAQK